MFTVCKNTYLLCSFNQRFIKLLPRAPCQRDNAHIVIGHHKPVCKHLQGVERRIYHNLCLRHLTLDGIGKAEKQRVATGKNDNLTPIPSPKARGVLVLFEDGVKGYGDVNPRGISRQQRCNDLMMTLAARKHLPVLNNLQHLWRKPRLWMIRYSYYHKSHI